MRLRLTRGLAALVLAGTIFASCGWAAPAQIRAASAHTRYAVTLVDASEHIVKVEIDLPPGPSLRELQLPVWNATYQIRDFSEYVQWVHAHRPNGAALAVRKINKSRWQVQGAEQGAIVEYQTSADQPGPFGAQFNHEHAFFNLAELLMYAVEARDAPVSIHFAGIPDGWHLACPLQEGPAPQGATANELADMHAANYDVLVDSPVEIAQFEESLFLENGGQYRVVVHAAPESYDLPHLTGILRKIVHAETTWMQDRPFQNYLFIYHFPADHGEGGMEHAYSTAIELSSRSLKADPDQFASMTAHEFFHLWNVKRIRPQTLAPVDYTKENYTRALWFSEGVTSTVEQYALLSGGLTDEHGFLRNLSEEITALQNRPAHATQSAEESSLDAWLEKYPAYRQPDRSISYYNKGFLLGILLDLEMRKESNDQASLRDLFRYLNQNYARKDRFFDDSDGIRKAAELLTGSDLTPFFQKYVAGTDEIPYDTFLAWVGLHVVVRQKIVPDPGFRAARNFDSLPAVVYVAPESEASRAGLAVGDILVTVDGLPVSRDWESRIGSRSIGEALHLRVRSSNGAERDLAWKLGSRKISEFDVTDTENPTLDQLLHRKSWLAVGGPGVTHARWAPPARVGANP